MEMNVSIPYRWQTFRLGDRLVSCLWVAHPYDQFGRCAHTHIHTHTHFRSRTSLESIHDSGNKSIIISVDSDKFDELGHRLFLILETEQSDLGFQLSPQISISITKKICSIINLLPLIIGLHYWLRKRMRGVVGEEKARVRESIKTSELRNRKRFRINWSTSRPACPKHYTLSWWRTKWPGRQ